MEQPRIGLALGGGSARGWAHIGVIQALRAQGIEPSVVAGTSIGALVGAAFACGHLDGLEHWVRSLTRREVLRYLDFTLEGGGLIAGTRLIDFFRDHMPVRAFEELDLPFACVATELNTGREVWLQEGDLLDAVHASFALPGLFTPVMHHGVLLVDGGLVNPVPVSVCRALGAQIVIAVNLNGDILERFTRRTDSEAKRKRRKTPAPPNSGLGGALSQWTARAGALLSQLWEEGDAPERPLVPGLFDVMAGAINIMQVRITRSRMAGDPPDIVLTPRLSEIDLMEFHRAEEAIAEGRAAVARMSPALEDLFR